MISTTILATSFLFAALSSAQGYDTLTGSGTYGGTANQTPNATSTLPFSIGNQTTNWSWRINVTEIAVPTDDIDNSTTTPLGPDARLINTVYDLQWPGGNSIDTALNASTKGLCVTVVVTDWPGSANLSSPSTDGRDSCANEIGSECLNAITSSFTPNADESGCRTSTGLLNLEACSSVLGSDTAGGGGGSISTFSLSSPSQGNSSLRSGDGFLFSHSKPYPNSNATALEVAEGKLHMIILESGGQQIQPLCQRAKKPATTSTGSSGAGGASGTSAAPSATASKSSAERGVVGSGGMGAMVVVGIAALWLGYGGT